MNITEDMDKSFHQPSNILSNTTTQKRFPAQYESLQPVREFVADQAKGTRFDENDIYAILIAVDEAFTNIIEHAYGGECGEDIECTCMVNDGEFRITLIDKGIPFDPAEIREPDISLPIEDRELGGLGIHFIRMNMDEVRFSKIQREDQGDETNNQLVMVKRKVDSTQPDTRI